MRTEEEMLRDEDEAPAFDPPDRWKEGDEAADMVHHLTQQEWGAVQMTMYQVRLSEQKRQRDDLYRDGFVYGLMIGVGAGLVVGLLLFT